MLSRLKQSHFVRWIYKLTWLVTGYHIAMNLFGALIYRRPSRNIKVIGITGTKGKTSALELLSSIFETAGEKTALLSSVRVKIADKSRKNMTENSMPGRMFIQRFLRKAVRVGCSYAFVEATSQGAILYRHAFIRWAAAGITNIHPEHIEAHGSYEKYRAAKLMFLSYVGHEGVPVFINGEMEERDFFETELKGARVVFYDAKNLPEIPTEAKEFLPGEFSRQNVALAAAIAREFGVSEEAITEGLKKFRGVPGRAEIVQKEPFKVVVDYAHTAESLGAIYGALRADLNGKLICVLGAAGGGRDKWKRSKLGKTAASYCDTIILTNEDPYDEDPADIIAQVKSGIEEANFDEKKVLEVLDRKEALRKAVRLAGNGDTVVATGKGSEAWIHGEGGEKTPWNEREIFEEILKEKK